MKKLFNVKYNGGIDTKALRKTLNEFIEKNEFNFCTITEEEMCNIASVKEAFNFTSDFVITAKTDEIFEESAIISQALSQHIFNLNNGIVEAPLGAFLSICDGIGAREEAR